MKKLLENIIFMFSYAWRLDKWYLLLRIPFIIIKSFVPLVYVVFPALIVEDVTFYLDYKRVCGHAVLMAGMLFVSNILSNYLYMLITNRYNSFEHKHARELGKKIMTVEFSETENPDTLNLVERIRKIGYIENSFEAIFSFISSIITIAGLVWILASISYLIITMIVIAVILNTVINNKSKQFNYIWEKEQTPFIRRNEYLLRLMYGFQYGKEVRVNGLESYFTEKYEKHSKEYLEKLRKGTIKYLHLNNAASSINVIQLLVVYISLAGNVLSGAITIAAFTKYVSAINSLTTELTRSANRLVDIKNNFNYVEDLRTFLLLKDEEVKQKKLPQELNDFTIEFRNVSFRYPNAGKYALKDINITIAPRSKITIVGLNGSGKTTFVKLMLGLYKPTEGMILVNGINIEELNFEQYISNFSCAFQDYRLFSYSVRENIVLSQQYEEAKVIDTVKKCGIFNAINSLPKKFDTSIFRFLDDEGVEFSGGEGQKIAIARALYKKSKVLILDEPLAALDPIAEYDMYMGLNEMVSDRTCMFISHRLSLAHNSDKILVFHNGEIVESGTHSELMNISGGLYAEMFEKQSMFYKEDRIYEAVR